MSQLLAFLMVLMSVAFLIEGAGRMLADGKDVNK
jgi:hypothetical protein